VIDVCNNRGGRRFSLGLGLWGWDGLGGLGRVGGSFFGSAVSTDGGSGSGRHVVLMALVARYVVERGDEIQEIFDERGCVIWR